MVCPYLKNKGSAVRFCLWPQMNDKTNKLRYRTIVKHFFNRLKKNFINSRHNLIN